MYRLTLLWILTPCCIFAEDDILQTQVEYLVDNYTTLDLRTIIKLAIRGLLIDI